MIRAILLHLFVLWPWFSTAAPAAPLEVGIKPAPPFVMQDENGRWTGISVELWRAAAEALDIEYRLHPYELETLLQALESGSIDVGVGALTITAQQEARFENCWTGRC